MPVETVAAAFAAYQQDVLPLDAPDVQIVECRRAFYAAAYYMLLNMLTHIAALEDDDGVAALEQLKAECEAFSLLGEV